MFSTSNERMPGELDASNQRELDESQPGTVAPDLVAAMGPGDAAIDLPSQEDPGLRSESSGDTANEQISSDVSHGSPATVSFVRPPGEALESLERKIDSILMFLDLHVERTSSHLGSLDAALANVLAAASVTGERLDKVVSDLSEMMRIGKRNADLSDRLYSDIQTLRGGELLQAQAPLIRDMIGLHDDIDRLDSAGGGDNGDLRLVRTQLLSALARSGIIPVSVGIGDSFDPKIHSGAARVPTSDASQKDTVAMVRRKGFRRDGGQMLRAAEVDVFHHEGKEVNGDLQTQAPLSDLGMHLESS